MDRVLVISNVSSKELGDFISQRGAFSVAGCYSSLSENIVDIQNNIVDVAKTIYLYQPEEGSTNIRTDMQLLQNMLQNNSFFKPGEIIFMTRGSQQCERAKEYFITVMKSCKKEDYLIKTIQGSISFSDVYNCLLGISDVTNFKNSYRTYYRTERNSNTSVYYEKQDDTDLIIEPYNFNNLKNYEKQKDVLQSMTSPVVFRDDDEAAIEQFQNPRFNLLQHNTVQNNTKVCIISGKPKSGLSTWASALSISGLKAEENILTIDLTVNRDVLFQVSETIDEYTEYSEKDILQHRNNNKGLSICSYGNIEEFNTRFNFLQILFAKIRPQYDNIIIAVDYRDYVHIADLLKGEIQQVMFSVVPRYSDVLELLDFTDHLHGSSPIVLMNECIKCSEELMTQEQIKESLEFIDAKVVSSIWFNSLDVGPELYNALLASE